MVKKHPGSLLTQHKALTPALTVIIAVLQLAKQRSDGVVVHTGVVHSIIWLAA